MYFTNAVPGSVNPLVFSFSKALQFKAMKADTGQRLSVVAPWPCTNRWRLLGGNLHQTLTDKPNGYGFWLTCFHPITWDSTWARTNQIAPLSQRAQSSHMRPPTSENLHVSFPDAANVRWLFWIYKVRTDFISKMMQYIAELCFKEHVSVILRDANKTGNVNVNLFSRFSLACI